MATFNTVVVKVYGDLIQEEHIASGVITPGTLVENTSTKNTVKAHDAAEGNAMVMIALENELYGKELTNDYASGDRVQVWYPRSGDVAYMLLADGETVTRGDYASSNGDGCVRKHDAETESWGVSEAGTVEVRPLQIVGQFLDTKNLSESSGAESSALEGNRYVRVRIR